jgi:hypothetical protein
MDRCCVALRLRGSYGDWNTAIGTATPRRTSVVVVA